MPVRLLAVLAAACVALALPAGAAAALTAVAAATPDRGAAPVAVSFDGSGSSADPGRTIVGWEWDFGDGASGSGAAVAHEYAAPGRYTATLTVTDDAGATSSAPVQVQAQAQTLTFALAPRTLVFGAATTASGAVSPAEAGITVVVERRAGTVWQTLATTTTAADGRFAANLAPAAGGRLRARVVDGGATSAEVDLSVLPRLALHRTLGRAFLGAPLTVDVRPLSYAGRVTVTTLRYGQVVGTVSARVRDGRARLVVPTPGIGRFAIRIRLSSASGLSARTVSASVRATARTLSLGSRGRDVRALLLLLAELHYRIRGVSTIFGWATYDAVIAFQKAVGLTRTGVVGATTWQALGRAHVLRARYARPWLHIEIDKRRQIIMVVRGGRVANVLPTSTGATGNTPLGSWRIYWKSPGYNSLGMYYSMYFLRGFAIHGYHSVPPWPASHGCARIPIWSAEWLFRQSSVGERVYVYI